MVSRWSTPEKWKDKSLVRIKSAKACRAHRKVPGHSERSTIVALLTAMLIKKTDAFTPTECDWCILKIQFNNIILYDYSFYPYRKHV